MSQNNITGGLPKDKKAVIVIKKKSGPEKRLTCHFNPTDYTISRDVTWQFKSVLGKDVPVADFQGGGSNKLTLKLLFDTTMEAGAPKDVRSDTKHLWDAAYIDTGSKDAVTNKSEPPHILFIWGTTWSFEAIITNISQEFTLFSDSGIPLRSNVTLSMTQVVDDRNFGRQNPTSGGIQGKIHVVREGDRLDLIANQYYSKPMKWRDIADYNNIDNPRLIKPGMRLVIPE
jgi:hypothetical protein